MNGLASKHWTVTLANQAELRQAMPATFAESLREAMARRDLSSKALAIELHVDQSTVCTWLHGRSHPPFQRLLELCRVLRTSPNVLTGWYRL